MFATCFASDSLRACREDVAGRHGAWARPLPLPAPAQASALSEPPRAAPRAPLSRTVALPVLQAHGSCLPRASLQEQTSSSQQSWWEVVGLLRDESRDREMVAVQVSVCHGWAAPCLDKVPSSCH